MKSSQGESGGKTDKSAEKLGKSDLSESGNQKKITDLQNEV